MEELRAFDGYGVWMDCVDIDNILLEMAEWKEQQIIEKTINFFNNNHHINCGWIDDVEIDKFADEYVKYMKEEI